MSSSRFLDLIPIVALAVVAALVLDPFSLIGFMALLVIVGVYLTFVLSRGLPLGLRIVSVCIALLVPIAGIPFVVLTRRVRRRGALERAR